MRLGITRAGLLLTLVRRAFKDCAGGLKKPTIALGLIRIRAMGEMKILRRRELEHYPLEEYNTQFSLEVSVSAFSTRVTIIDS